MGEPKLDVDPETVQLANDLQAVIGTFILKFKDEDYKTTIASCLIASAIIAGRLRWLSCETGEVDPDKFDEIFLTAVVKHFEENKRRYSGSH